MRGQGACGHGPQRSAVWSTELSGEGERSGRQPAIQQVMELQAAPDSLAPGPMLGASPSRWDLGGRAGSTERLVHLTFLQLLRPRAHLRITSRSYSYLVFNERAGIKSAWAAARFWQSVLWKFNISEDIQGPTPWLINIVEAEAGCRDEATSMDADGIQPIEGLHSDHRMLTPQRIMGPGIEKPALGGN